MVNIQTKINKLIKAFLSRGIVYKINTQQYYSVKKDKICTKMILWEEHPKKDGEEFYSKVELVKYLAVKWKEVMADEKGGNKEKTQ